MAVGAPILAEVQVGAAGDTTDDVAVAGHETRHGLDREEPGPRARS
jgi:hypothetical protein